jgi:hypothetical protein
MAIALINRWLRIDRREEKQKRKVYSALLWLYLGLYFERFEHPSTLHGNGDVINGVE